MRRLAIVLVLACVMALAVGGFLWLWDGSPRVEPTSGRPDARVGVARDAALPAPADEGSGPVAGIERELAPSKRDAGADGELGATGWIAIDGSVDVWPNLDTNDPLPPMSGRFELTIVADGKERRETVKVASGRFTTSAPAGALLEATKFELDGRTAWRNGEIRRPLPDDGKVAMNAVLLGEVALHVVDAATEAELRDVTIVATSAPREHPGVVVAADVLVDRRASPVIVGPFLERDVRRGGARVGESSDVWVGAPDHAWTRARLDFDGAVGGAREMRVPLVLGGALVVELRAARPIAPEDAGALELRLSSSSGDRTFLEAPVDTRRPTTIASIEPGLFQATVGKFEDFGGTSSADTWGEASVEVVAGKESRVTIDVVPPSEKAPGIAVGGTLEVASSWGPLEGFLDFEPVEEAATASDAAKPRLALDTMAVERPEPRTLRFETRVSKPGRWRATAGSLGLEQEFDVGPDGTDGLRLVAPDSAELRLAFADARSQQPIAPVEFRWTVGPPTERSTWNVALVPEGATSLALRVPVGPLVIWADREGYGPCAERLEVAAGVNERRIELDLPVGLRVTFEVAGAPVEVSIERCPLHVQPVEGEGEGEGALVQWSHLWQRHELNVSAPGRFRVHCDELAGYEPVPPFEVELARGALQDVTIKLVRGN